MNVEGRSSLIDWIRRVRPNAVERDGVLIVRPVPLMVAAAYFLDDEELFEVYDGVLTDVRAQMGTGCTRA